jgi:hypothetical protein
MRCRHVEKSSIFRYRDIFRSLTGIVCNDYFSPPPQNILKYLLTFA